MLGSKRMYLDSGYIDAGSTVASVMVGGENGPAEPSTGMSATLATTRAAPSLCSSYAMRPRSSKATPCAALFAPSTTLPTQPYGAREELPPVSRADPALPPRLGLGDGGVPQGEEAREKDKNWMVRGFVGDGGVAGGDVWHIGFVGSVWFLYHNYHTQFPRKESHMYGVLNEVYL